jgi:transposase
VSVKKPWLKKKHIKERLKFAIAHKDWTLKKWKKVLWSDETMITLRSKLPRKVWRLKSEKYNIKCMTPIIRQDKRVKLWGCFSFDGVGKLYQIKGILNGVGYHKILQNQMFPSAKALFGRKEWIFQQDNAPVHTYKPNMKYLEKKGTNIMDWPACSPDLNPIENLWHILDQNTSKRQPKNETDLFKVLEDAWKNIEKEKLENLVKSMQKRCQKVIENKGYSIEY